MADRVLIRRIDGENKTASGFFIPDALVEKANKGTVVAIGAGRQTKDGNIIPIADITLGDIIMFEGDGINVKVDGEQLVILKEEEIIAIVN